MLKYLVALGVFAVLFCLAYVVGEIYGVEWIKAFSGNLAAGFIATIIIVFLVDRVLEQKKREERARITKIAIGKLRIPLIHQIIFLVQMFKAAVPAKPKSYPVNLQEFFSESYYTEIGSLDFSKEAPVIPRMTWLQYAATEVQRFKRDLDRIVDKYATFLESDLIGLLEEASSSHFVSFVPQFTHLPEVDRQFELHREYTLLSGEVTALVRDHVQLMLELVSYYGSSMDEPLNISLEAQLRDDVAPQYGSARAS